MAAGSLKSLLLLALFTPLWELMEVSVTHADEDPAGIVCARATSIGSGLDIITDAYDDDNRLGGPQPLPPVVWSIFRPIPKDEHDLSALNLFGTRGSRAPPRNLPAIV